MVYRNQYVVVIVYNYQFALEHFVLMFMRAVDVVAAASMHTTE